jgi:hypothetical protein
LPGKAQAGRQVVQVGINERAPVAVLPGIACIQQLSIERSLLEDYIRVVVRGFIKGKWQLIAKAALIVSVGVTFQSSCT